MEILFHVQILHEKFMKRFSKCTFKSVTDEQFDIRGWEMVRQSDQKENE